MSQNKFVFKPYRILSIDEPILAIALQKEKLLKSGHISKGFRSQRIWAIDYEVAKANVSLEERRKLQIEVDKIDPNVPITKPYLN